MTDKQCEIIAKLIRQGYTQGHDIMDNEEISWKLITEIKKISDYYTQNITLDKN